MDYLAASPGSIDVSTSSDSPTVQLESSADAAALVRQCAADGRAIVDYGVAHAGLGYAPPQLHTRVAMRGSVIEHYERDLAIRTSAGATIGELRTQLAASRQTIPLDADDDLTIGEVLSHNVYGPNRLGFGSIRDHLLGLRYIDGQGDDIGVGGRTVKNVAGYDLTRFMAGGLGQFGLVTEITMRTAALPEQAMTLDAGINTPEQIDAHITPWMLSAGAPAGIRLWLDGSTWRLQSSWFGAPASCEAQQRAMLRQLEGNPGFDAADTQVSSWDAYQSRAAEGRRSRRNAAALVKAIVPPATTGKLVGELHRWATDQTDIATNTILIDAMPAHGCVFIGGDLSASQAEALDGELSKQLQSAAGACVWHARPVDARVTLFGPTQPEWNMLQAVKRTMDPQNIFNRERFLHRAVDPNGSTSTA